MKQSLLSANERWHSRLFRTARCDSLPGTPRRSFENMVKYKDAVYCEWSVNEKVAMEVAIWRLHCRRARLVAMKHWTKCAMDPLMTLLMWSTRWLGVIFADTPVCIARK